MGSSGRPQVGTQPFVAPGAQGVSAQPLRLQQEGWALAGSPHGLEQGAQG